ncbi:MAG: tRNA lysidine(34) synthetase TilS [Syntrophomonadaceae bacterium]
MRPIQESLLRAAGAGLLPRHVRALLAVSGGPDSMALLHGAVEVAGETGWELCVAHVHHGWRGREADRDLAFVAEHARRLGLPFLFRRRDAAHEARRLGLSPEAGARHVRYAALLEMAAAAGAERIATAHHRDDALESHLIALERGGGLAALAGPREARADGVVRPLLHVGREEILSFLAGRGIAFRRDASNGDLRFLRNRIRRRLADWRRAPGGSETLRGLEQKLARLRDERERLETAYETRVSPGVRRDGGDATVDAALLARCPSDLVRLALERLAAPFARTGRAPMTGRERERLVALVASGMSFRFEAGRRICFERRRGVLRVRLRDAGPVYHAADIPTFEMRRSVS